MSDIAAIVLQARMGSARLPGKSLAPLAGRPLVARVVERLAATSGVPVVVATTTLAEDDVLVEAAERLGVPVFRGSSDDVLARYAFVASAIGVTHVVRATADNPAVDIDAPRRTLDVLRRTGADYVIDFGLPVGGAVEAFTASALYRAAALATDPYDREHVTPFIKRDPRARALDLLAPTALRRAELRFTVDTAEDLDYMRRLYAEVGETTVPATLEAFITAADRLAIKARHAEPGADAR